MTTPAILVKDIKLRHPFKINKIPLISRIYKYPAEKWPTPGKQALFGVFNFLTFYAYQRLMPFKAKGSFLFRIGNSEKPILFNASNTQFDSLYLSVYANGYEPEISALLDAVPTKQGVFYDVGSNWGYFSLFVASNPNFEGRIHAFEPYPSSFTDLKSVVEQAGLLDRIQLHRKALADRSGMVDMVIPDFLHSGWATIASETQGRVKSGKTTVEVATMDSLNIDPPSVLKIDAERSEANVLKGAQKVITEHRPWIIFESLRTFEDPALTLEPFWVLERLEYIFFRPCWLRTENDKSYLLGADYHARELSEDCLALVPLVPGERFLCPDHLNVFACHRDSLSRLEELFPRRYTLTPHKVC